uniref:Uncharacterized protein n=1 Tax=Kalanchoe fedtschenkoi TaxID=63787 RepID=A0A7N1A443_KALFE
MEEEKSKLRIGISICDDEEEQTEDENCSWDLKEINRAKYERSRLMKLIHHKKEVKQTKARRGKFEKSYPDGNFPKKDKAWYERCEDGTHLVGMLYKRTAYMKT